MTEPSNYSVLTQCDEAFQDDPLDRLVQAWKPCDAGCGPRDFCTPLSRRFWDSAIWRNWEVTPGELDSEPIESDRTWPQGPGCWSDASASLADPTRPGGPSLLTRARSRRSSLELVMAALLVIALAYGAFPYPLAIEDQTGDAAVRMFLVGLTEGILLAVLHLRARALHRIRDPHDRETRARHSAFIPRQGH